MACLNRFFGLSRIFYDRQTSLKDADKELLTFTVPITCADAGTASVVLNIMTESAERAGRCAVRSAETPHHVFTHLGSVPNACIKKQEKQTNDIPDRRECRRLCYLGQG